MSNFKQNFKHFLKSFHEKAADSSRSFFTKMSANNISNVRNKFPVIEKNSGIQQNSLLKTAINLLHRFIGVIIRAILILRHGQGHQMPPIRDLTILEPATSIAYKIRTKKIASVQVLKSYIERIKEVNPLLNCVVDQRFDDALKNAAEADLKIMSGDYTEKELEERWPFLGVPISTKDCIAVEGMMHTAGLYKRRDIRAKDDADAIRLMRNAGAIPFALTNVSECCMWWESSNPVHGRTRNPYDTNRIVGGSSGGEGCIQAAAASPFGLGSDIGGSIRIPAFFNGIFGHKPSKFIVSNTGQYPMPSCEEQTSFLGIGPMSRFACDLKPVLKIIAGENAKLLNLDEAVNLENVKFFYQESDGGGYLISPVDTDIRDVLRKVVKHLENVFKVKPTEVQIPKLKSSSSIWLGNMKDNTGIGFDSQLANLEGRVNPYWELCKWLVGCSHHTFVGLMTAVIEKNGVRFGSDKHLYLVKKRDELLAEMQELLGDDGVFLYPTHPTVAPYHNEPLARTFNFSYTAIINVLGLPATAIPLGLGSEGVPIGIQVVANHNQDRLCLAVAAELERAFGGWVAPKIDA